MPVKLLTAATIFSAPFPQLFCLKLALILSTSPVHRLVTNVSLGIEIKAFLLIVSLKNPKIITSARCPSI